MIDVKSAHSGATLGSVLVLKAFLFTAMFLTQPAFAGEFGYGAFGPEGPRMREQLWLLPSTDPSTPLRATLFKPPHTSDDERFPLVVINHGTDEATRLAVSMPVYYWLSRWFVERGYAVLLPQRRGHGSTGGPLAEGIGSCDAPDHFASGLAAARDLAAAISYIKTQPFIDSADIIAAGISSGGWASLALDSLDAPPIKGVINFAGGRGGHAYGHANEVCDEGKLVQAAALYARTAHAPTIWFYAKNDSYFGPQVAERLAAAWSGAGGTVEVDILAPYGEEGHTIADDRAGWDLWGPALEHFLRNLNTTGETVAGLHTDPPQTLASGAELPVK